MEQPRAKRKLAAILSADAVGYSRLMQADEAGTVAFLQEHRALIRRIVEDHHGRIVNAPGDSVLAEFPSAVEAVGGAIEIQNALARRHAELAPDRRMSFRIGVNLGDVIEEADGSLYGDGVNIAARLEALAEGGGVCISGKVFDEVEGKVDMRFDFIGEKEVKNIARPVRAFRLRLPAASALEQAAGAVRPAPLALPDKPSIVVLPFENMSGDPEQSYFADGIAEDLMTALSKISGLFVIARNSAFTYKGRAVNVQDVSRALGVRYVIEGSVRKAGNRVRITAQLIDGTSGGHLWAERYDRNLDDIFALQDEVTDKIVQALALRLSAGEQAGLAHKGTQNLEAYEAFLRGRELFWLLTKDGVAMAQPLLERAVKLDPGFGAAYATYALAHNVEYLNRWSEAPERSQQSAVVLVQRALALDPHDPWVHFAACLVYLWDKRHDESLAAGRQALELEPNFAPAHEALGASLIYAGRPGKALPHLDTAMRLNPFYPDIYLYTVGLAYCLLGRYTEAIEVLRRRLARNPASEFTHVLLAACHGHLGETELARADWAAALRVNPSYSLVDRRKVVPFKNPSDFDRIVAGLRKAGIDQALALASAPPPTGV